MLRKLVYIDSSQLCTGVRLAVFYWIIQKKEKGFDAYITSLRVFLAIDYQLLISS